MSFDRTVSLMGMSETTQAPTTISNIGVVMFTVADQDAAVTFYTETLGWEVRSDVTFGEGGEMRWIEVAPPGSTARLAVNPPMMDEPGGGTIGVETPDVDAEHERLVALGVEIVNPLRDVPGAPRMFSIADPDGNNVWIVETPDA